MAPPFSSPRQAAAFALLLLACLLAPGLIGTWLLPPREQIYSSIGWRAGSFPYMYRQIFEEKGDIDIAFVGSSHIYFDIDTAYVQKQLSQKLGRPATVLTFGWFSPGFDASYFFTRDLLAHRKVRLLVFYENLLPDSPPEQPHVSSWRWVRYGDDGVDLAGLPLGVRIWYYYGTILGMPRNLYNELRPNLPPPDSQQPFQSQNYFHALFPPDHLGAFMSQVGYIDDADGFASYSPKTPTSASDVVIYSAETKEKFHLSDTPAASLQTYFAEKFLSVAQEHDTRLACLYLPILSERSDTTIPVGHLWYDTFRGHADLVGIPPIRLFEGLGLDDVKKLYGDPVHFNRNGQAYFTPIVTPALIQLYEQSQP
jgi:hypothetical protein